MDRKKHEDAVELFTIVLSALVGLVMFGFTGGTLFCLKFVSGWVYALFTFMQLLTGAFGLLFGAIVGVMLLGHAGFYKDEDDE